MPGYFVMVLDTELAWGSFDFLGFNKYKKHFKYYRENIDKLVKLLDEYEIKATWAFVGHLLLDRCDGVHKDILRPRYSWFNNQDWHKYDPGSNIHDSPIWYGKDILEKVLSAKIKQEIATHTFSHVILGDKECTKEVAISQIESCVRLGKELGIDIKSLVYPKNNIGHLDQLYDLGIRVYRGEELNWYRSYNRVLKRFSHFFDQLLAVTPPVYPIKNLKFDYNVLNIPASQYLFPYDGVRKGIPSMSRKVKAIKGIKKAIENDAIYVLWFHPFNLGSSDKMFDVLKKILSFTKEQINNGKIINFTMSELYSYHEKNFQ